jgi:hypothetical protein
VADDFNGDGVIDLAVANAGSGTVSIFLGDGDGTFVLVSSPYTGGSPNGLVAGDFNGHGKPDLAVATGDNVAILLGNGDGTFVLGSSPSAGSNTEWIAAGDFNGDGKLDVAVNNDTSPGNVSILLGNGDGTFTLSSSPGVASDPRGLAVGDFNGDGKLDLAVVSAASNMISILLNNGDGTFATSSFPGPGSWVDGVAVGDFNGDGKLDLAVSDYFTSNVYILSGNGDGTFSLTSSVAVGSGPGMLQVGNFSGDGNLDLAVNDNTGNSASILLGDGTGSFSLSSSLATGATPWSVAVSDFNNDGKLDFATANYGNGTVSVFLQLSTSGVGLSPSSLSFAAQLVSTSSAPQGVTLTNTGSSSLSISSIAASGDFAQTNSCGSSVAAGASCTINVTFTPTAPGTRSGTITITDDAPGSPHVISLSGTGTGPAVSFSASTMSVGAQIVGTTSAAHQLTLTNSGNAALNITGMTLSPASFSETNTCGTNLAAGASCTISVTFTPTKAGEISGMLSITDNAWGSPQQVALAGIGQDFGIGTYNLVATIPAGATAAYDLAVWPEGGFNEAVSLACSGAPQQSSTSFC